ncbi:MAG: hypothetical protein LUI05_02240 [Oscillospiraceae bacterium]|nr:hypothetical protein [Oscillospiraceae bacterium]
MTAKEYLQQAYIIDKRLEENKLRLANMRSSAYSRSAPCGFDGSRQHKHGGFDGAIIRLVDFEKKIEEETVRLMDTKREIDGVIQQVASPRLREVLIRRYLGFERWRDIAAAMGYDERHIMRLNAAGLAEVEKIIGKK